jgi:peptide deformylase
MALFPIRVFGDPVLRIPAEPVVDFDSQLERLVDDMLETMYDAPGVGLAAPQIGISRQVFVFDIGEGPGHLINPVLEATSGEWEFEEGCLSIPQHFWALTRPGYARVRGVDVTGKETVVEGDELTGRMLQHEFDHLQGMLLIERLPKQVKKAALRELREEALGLRVTE